MSEMFENLTPLTMPINTFVRNDIGTFRRNRFEEGKLGWVQIDCGTCTEPCEEVIYDHPSNPYMPQALAPMTTEEFFATNEITDILAMPPLWVAEEVGKALVADIIPTALSQHYENRPSPRPVDYSAPQQPSLKDLVVTDEDLASDVDWSNMNDRDN